MKEKPSYAELVKERERLVKRLGDCPPILRGTIRLHGNKCGRPKCRCKDPENPVLHLTTYRFDDKGVDIESSTGHSRLAWNQFQKW